MIVALLANCSVESIQRAKKEIGIIKDRMIDQSTVLVVIAFTFFSNNDRHNHK